jgi:xanthine dehydrogenase YagR molybdenum-binding subunit
VNTVIGKPLDRVDGRAKVTGAAKYSAEFQIPNMAHAFLVQSTIAKGRIRAIDTSAAEKSPGVLGILTHKNAPKLNKPKQDEGSFEFKISESGLLPLQGDEIFYDGQHVAAVMADTFEQARYAAGLVKVEYERAKPVFEIEQAIDAAYEAKNSFGRPLQAKRGDPESAIRDAVAKVENTYVTPVLHHNPMEPHATIAHWERENLTLYDSTQWVAGTRKAAATLLGISPERVRVVTLFVGGGFGCKGFFWSHPVIAAMAAKQVGRPVKIVLTRQQMFTSNGHRGRTIQKVGLGALADGKLKMVRHITTTQTSFVEEFPEPSGLTARILYDSPALEMKHLLVKLNTGTPCPTRAPGEATGVYALESAVDELAYELKIDPLELRLRNYAEINPHNGQKWSSKHLRECYAKGAEMFGWSKRAPAPKSMREGKFLVGYGMATMTYPGNRSPAAAKAQIFVDGRAVISSCTQDIGTGTYTIMTQIAAEALGLPVERVEFKLGDSRLPEAPVSGGSQTAVSVGSAVRAAAMSLRSKIIAMAAADAKSPLRGHKEEEFEVENGRMFLKSDSSKGESYADVLKRAGMKVVEADCKTNVSTRERQKSQNTQAQEAQPSTGGGCFWAEQDEKTDHESYSFHSFGVHFAKVLVDPDIGKVMVKRWVSVVDAGRILNLKTARNQICGGVVMGLGMALMEETVFDPQTGRIITRDLANYHVPVHADMPEIEVEFIDAPDPFISPLGSRGIGEIGITGAPAAIANAVFHATGIRVRDLPIVPEKLTAFI